MLVGMKHLALVLTTLAMAANGQDLEYLNPPTEEWREQFPPIGEGNGVYVSPDGAQVVGISSTCFVKAFTPGGETLWQYPTELLDGATGIECRGGVTFSYEGSTRYLTYMAVDNVGGTETTRIIALGTNGVPLYQSTALVGSGAGSPQTTSDGRYIVATHNENFVGYFSVIDTENGDPLALSPIFEDDNADFNSTYPFGPVGVFHNPVRGNYLGGENNDNDLFLWGNGINPNDLPIVGGHGQHWVFQFPENDGVELEMIPIGPPRGWQSDTRPIISNEGLSMWWSQAKGDFRCWADTSFSGAFTNFVEQGRGSPAYIGARAPPTLSSDANEPTVYGPTPGLNFFRANFDCSEYLDVATDSVVSGEAVVSPDDDYVYFATQGGFLYQRLGTDLTEVWNVGGGTSTVPLSEVLGDIAMSPDGSKIYVGERTSENQGNIVAINVAVNNAPTASPVIGGTPPPTTSPVEAETAVPTSEATTAAESDMPSTTAASDMPSSVPSGSSGPTPEGQTKSPTMMPVTKVPTDMPTMDPGLETEPPTTMDPGLETEPPTAIPTGSPIGGGGGTSGSIEISSFFVLALAAIVGLLY